jgi:hypothetical protein
LGSFSSSTASSSRIASWSTCTSPCGYTSERAM